MIRIFENDIAYDCATGKAYLVGHAIREALRRRFDIDVDPGRAADPNLLREADLLIAQRQQAGELTNKSLTGVASPSDFDIESPQCDDLTFEVTERCNLRCAYCVYSCSSVVPAYRAHGHREMNLRLADRALEAIAPRLGATASIGFYGGEPLLNYACIRHLALSVRALRPDWKGTFSVTTNLTHVGDDAIDFLIDNNFLVVVSLDGPKEIHDRNRRTTSGEGSHDAVMQNVGRILARDRAYFTSHVVSNTVVTDGDDIGAIEKFFAAGVPRFLLSRFTVAVGMDFTADVQAALDNYVLARLDGIQSIEDIIQSPLLLNYVRVYLNTFGARLRPDAQGRRAYVACIPGQHVAVRIDGMFGVCEKCESLEIGSCTGGIDTAKTRRLVGEWVAMLEDRCVRCWAQAFCKACFVHCWSGTKLSIARLDSYCAHFQRWAERAFPTFLNLARRVPSLWVLLDESTRDMIG